MRVSEASVMFRWNGGPLRWRVRAVLMASRAEAENGSPFFLRAWRKNWDNKWSISSTGLVSKSVGKFSWVSQSEREPKCP